MRTADCLWESSCLYLSPPQSPPPLSGRSVCPTQRGHVLSGQCLLKTSLESRWHRQDTTALSPRTRLSLSPRSFFHGPLFTPLALPLSLTPLILPPHKPHHVLPSLSIHVTSLLLFVLSVLSFLPLSLASLCSQRVAVADTVAVVSWLIVCSSDKFKFVMISVCM